MRSVLAVRAVTTPQFGFAYVAEAVRAWAWNFVVSPVDLSLSLGFSHPPAPPLLPQHILFLDLDP